MSLIYIGFIIWASLSYFYAINPTEVIVNITKTSECFINVSIDGIFYSLSKKKLNLFVGLFIILGRVYAVIIEAKDDYLTGSFLRNIERCHCK